MTIKKNEQIATMFINKFAEFGKNIEDIELKYDRRREEFYKKLQKDQCTDEEIDYYFNEYENDKYTAIKFEREKNKPIIQELKKVLKSYTQEMLVMLYNNCDNEQLKFEIAEQVSKNNAYIDHLNNNHMESGAIFEIIEHMTEKELKRVVFLRESKEDLIFHDMCLETIGSKPYKYLIKVLSGENLQEEKEKYCIQNGINNELEFQFHKKELQNKRLLEEAKSVQESANNLLGIEDDAFIEMAVTKMSGIKSKIYSKKR